MAKIKVIFFDLDGTLIKPKTGKVFPEGIWDLDIKFDVWDRIKDMKPDYIGIVTNQGGIEKGYIKSMDFHRKISYIASSLREYVSVKKTYIPKVFFEYCPILDPTSSMRKPNTGMLNSIFEKIKLFNPEIKLSDCIMVGDASGEGSYSDEDKKCAEKFGITYYDVKEFSKPI